MRRSSRKGSALVAVIWLLAVLSILIASYAVDAHLQTRINIYLRERVTVDHLTEAGLAIAEVILTDYQNVSEAASDSELEEKLEDDRWYTEKLSLKSQGGKEVTTGAVPVDALNPNGGTVSVTIRPIESKLNINNLYAGGDQNFGEIWMRILAVSGIPKDYWDGIVNGWCDWRDTDGTMTGGTRSETAGAETDFYADLKAIKGFNEYDEKPINADAILNGGVLNPAEDEKDQIVVTNGISAFFSLYGSGKINVNAVKDPRVLAVIPGIFQGNPDDQRADDVEEAMAIAQKIIELRETLPTDGKSPLISSSDEENDTGAYKDFNNLQMRLQDVGLDIQNDASNYLSFQPDKFFEITIIGKSFGIVHKIVAVALVDGDKVRYLRWQEDP